MKPMPKLDKLSYSGDLREGNWEINKVSRAVIRAFRREKGKCLIAKLNHFDGFREYRKGMVYNFDADFCIMEADPDLESMLTVYNDLRNADDSQSPYISIAKICARIDELKGQYLLWV